MAHFDTRERFLSRTFSDYRPGVATLEIARTLALTLFCAACASAPPPASKPNPLLGDVMPSFESTTMNGNTLHSTGFHGSSFVVTFVDSDCERCEHTLRAAQQAYGDAHELVVVGVFRPGDERAIRALSARLELRFPLIVDQEGTIAKKFAVREVPSTFVVNSNGRVSWVGGSDLTEESLTRAIDATE